MAQRSDKGAFFWRKGFSAIRGLGEGLGGLLIPALCPLCHGEETGLRRGVFCGKCIGRLEKLEGTRCTCCDLPYGGEGPSHSCESCRRRMPAFEMLRAWGMYDGFLQEAVCQLKYGGDVALAKGFANLLMEVYDEWYEKLGYVTVVPVPCGGKRLRERGFDLPALLGRRLARGRELGWAPTALHKADGVPDLVGLNASTRSKAARAAFVGRRSLRGNVLLVDDVATTTATARACAEACMASGATSVFVLVLARTQMSHRQ